MSENHKAAMTKEKLNKMWNCSPLLPDPGGEVVRELITEVRRLQEAANEREQLVISSLVDQGRKNRARIGELEKEIKWRDREGGNAWDQTDG